MKVKSIVSKTLTNKWLLMAVAIIALFNIVGYMVMGKFNNLVFFLILAVLVRYFSKNMIIVLGVPLILVNLFALKEGFTSVEGFDKQKHSDTIDKINDEKRKKEQHPIVNHDEQTNNNSNAKNADDSNNVESSNVKSDEHFEVGRPKNGGSKIDYAATIENAYDELNKVLGSDGIKSLTNDTQRLMKQQMDLAESMKGLAPLVEKMMPMAQQMQGMMENMDTNGGGMSSIMEMAKKMSSSLGGAPKTA
jgi:hypothetical protein